MKPKIPPRKIKSDDCAINVGQGIEDGEIVDSGVPYYIHQGEWIEILPVITVAEVMNISRLQNAAGDVSGLDENLSLLCEELARRLVAWNWTGLMGEPLDPPNNRPDVLMKLSSDELMWLMTASSSQEAPDERKKDSGKSENTSSVTALNPVVLPSE